MVIGESGKPRAFKNMNMDTLPVYLKNKKKAWMDCALFQDWIHNQFVPKVSAFNKENRLPNRAILLIVNAPSHPEEMHLAAGDITAVFLPPNITSIV